MGSESESSREHEENFSFSLELALPVVLLGPERNSPIGSRFSCSMVVKTSLSAGRFHVWFRWWSLF